MNEKSQSQSAVRRPREVTWAPLDRHFGDHDMTTEHSQQNRRSTVRRRERTSDPSLSPRGEQNLTKNIHIAKDFHNG